MTHARLTWHMFVDVEAWRERDAIHGLESGSIDWRDGVGLARSLTGLRAGDFEPSPIGERLMPIIVGVGPALNALHEVAVQIRQDDERNGRRTPVGDWPESVRRTTEYADAMSLHDELESLSLELRDPQGVVVKTDWIAIQDTQRLVALAREELASEYPDMTFDDDDREPWEPEPPRYQILVALAGFERRMEGRAKRRH
jgi:hypothetical protein